MRALFAPLAASFLVVVALAGCEPPAAELPDKSPDEPVVDSMCGGLQGLSCGASAYCDYAPEARCAAADQTGICRPVPEACTMQYDPVCGCDGETYGNACTAAAEGVSVARAGECG